MKTGCQPNSRPTTPRGLPCMGKVLGRDGMVAVTWMFISGTVLFLGNFHRQSHLFF